jgi:hypothetical protein
LVTLFYNSRAEKRRAARDYISKVFDAARDDVRRAVEAASEYFPVSPAERTPRQEAKLWMGERDVRHSVASLIAFSEGSAETRRLLESSLDSFIDVLTGGSFQASRGDPDIAQSRAISAAGGKLRASIATARQRELEEAVSADLLSRNWKVISAYMSEQMGVVRKALPTRAPPPEE